MMLRSLISAAMLCAALLAVPARPAVAQDAPPPGPKAVLASTICTPVAAAAFDVRVHVRCSVGVSGIYYFAVATADANRAARSLALFSTALASGHDLRIYYDPANLSGATIGCQSGDCRMADAVELL